MKRIRAAGLFAGMIASVVPESAAQEPYAAQRTEMLAEIAAMARATASETGRAAFSPRVTAALAKVPRHSLVPPDQRAYGCRVGLLDRLDERRHARGRAKSGSGQCRDHADDTKPQPH